MSIVSPEPKPTQQDVDWTSVESLIAERPQNVSNIHYHSITNSRRLLAAYSSPTTTTTIGLLLPPPPSRTSLLNICIMHELHLEDAR